MKYFDLHEERAFKDVSGRDFKYLNFIHDSDPDEARPSIHSPNFKKLIINSGIRDYEIKDY